MNTRIKKAIPYLILCTVFTAISILIIFSENIERSIDTFLSEQAWKSLYPKLNKSVMTASTDETPPQTWTFETVGVLRQEDFKLSCGDWCSPPTPDYLLEPDLKNRDEIRIHNWETDQFSIVYKGRQFIIVNPMLYQAMMEACLAEIKEEST